jgi:phosphate transport system permease protein
LTPAPPDSSPAVVPDGPIAPKRYSLKRTFTATIAERSYFGLTILAGLIAVVAIGFFFWKTFAQTTQTWSTFGVWGFITGTVWNAQPITGNPVFGALPFIYGTAVTATIAMALAVPLAIGVALATTFVLPRRVRAPLAGMIDLLAAVPSVVYGLWGIVIMVPWINPRLAWISSHQMITVFGLSVLCGVVSLVLPRGVLKVVGFAIAAFLFLSWFLALIGVIGRSFRLLDGPVLSGSYVSAGLVLAVMVLPIITAITREVFVTVPREQEEAAYALGATRWEMIRDAVLPWSRSGIVGASTLGLGRAVGETIAIAILIGDQPNILNSLFGPGATLAGWIALQTGEASGLQLSALTALAVVLFGLTLLTNLGARLVTRRSPRSGGRKLSDRIFFRRATGEVAMPEIEIQDDDGDFADASEPIPSAPAAVRESAGIADVSPQRRRQARLATVGIYGAVVLALIPLGLVIGEIVVQGVQELSIDFFTQLPPVDPSNTAGAGISNALVGTLIMVGIGTAIAAPLGILTALLMYESALSGRIGARLASAMGLFVDLLLGVPSIVVGMICYLAIVIATQQFDALTGGIALSIIMFPIIVRTADEVIRLVPSDLSEAALALGAPKWRTALRIVIPAALPGILTGVVLAIARAAGETAPLLFTAGSSNFFSTDIFQPMASMPIVIYNLVINARTPQSTQFAWGATLVLVAMILVLNLIARYVGHLARGTER